MQPELRNEFYTRSELAGILRMSLPTLDRRIKANRIHAAKSGPARGASVVISRDSFYAAIEARRRGEL
jgi:hypothetical protein